jgi:DNA-binding IclR family transcriptional regulator
MADMQLQHPEPAARETQDAPQTALARGIRILQCFTPEAYDLSGKELVQRSGLPKPTAFRIIGTLRELGLIRYSERRNKYMLAPGVLTLSAPLLASMTIRSIARPMMQELADYAEGQVTLAASTEDYRLIFVEALQGRGNSVFRPELGTAVSLTKAASGRAFVVSLPEEESAPLIERILAANPSRGDGLASALDETRNDLASLGYCRNRGELQRNTVGVAVPVRGLIDDQRYVFACSVAAYRLNEAPKLIDDLGMRLASLVHNVEIAMGSPRG